MGYVIASVAGFNPCEVIRVGAESYALTLWTFVQRKESEALNSFVREAERIDAADMMTRGFIKGIEPIAQRANALRQKMLVGRNDRPSPEKMLAHAREQWVRHHSHVTDEVS